VAVAKAASREDAGRSRRYADATDIVALKLPMLLSEPEPFWKVYATP
jgi:hypothetical protein